MKKSILILLLSAFVLGTLAQEPTSDMEFVPYPQHKPKMMVIPFTKEGEDIRTILEDDVNKRIALTKIKEAFDRRGYTMVDFFGRVRALSTAKGLGMEQQQDYKTMIIQQSGADIYVEAETDVLVSPTGNAVKIIMTAYESSTGNSLSNTVGESGKFYTDDFGKLTSRAVETCMDGFLDIIQEKFYNIIEDGQSISITIGVGNGSSYLMSSEIGSEGLSISDHLELWMEDNAYKNNYHIQGTTDRQMIFDDVRIPLKDENGRNYNINKFGLKLLSFFRSMGISIERSISNNTLVITIK